MCVDLRCQFILWYTKVDLWTLNPIIHKSTTQQRQKEHWPRAVSDCQTVSLMAVVCALKNVLKNNRSGNDLMSQQENWAIKENPKTTRLTPIEKLHSRSRTSTMCTFGKKNACVHVHSEFQLMKWLLRVWPLSVSSDGCYHCFFFICFEWKPVIRLGWLASYMVLPEQMYDFSFVCERGRGYVSDTEKTSKRSCGPCQLAAQFCVMQENTQSFHLDRE